MARPPKEENKDNPLRKLREVLGGDDTPVPQQQLAEFLGVSPETIKAIEGGKRQRGGLNEEILGRAYINLGAYWSETDQAWFSAGNGESFSREHGERWRKAGFDRDIETHALVLRLLLLLDYAPSRKFKRVADTVELKIREILKEFGYQPDNHDADWQNTKVQMIRNDQGRYVRRRPIWAARQGELFDFSYRKDFVTPRNRHGEGL